MEDRYDATPDDRCVHCGRTDVDADWLWVELRRLGEEDCDYDTAELAFCTQAHAAVHLRDATIAWEHEDGEVASGVRADRFMLGCGLLAVLLSVIGLVALLRWAF